MKNLIITVALVLTATTSMASNRPFTQCVAERLQAYNSSIYYDLSKAEIVEVLDDSTHAFHSDVVKAAKSCLENSN